MAWPDPIEILELFADAQHLGNPRKMARGLEGLSAGRDTYTTTFLERDAQLELRDIAVKEARPIVRAEMTPNIDFWKSVEGVATQNARTDIGKYYSSLSTEELKAKQREASRRNYLKHKASFGLK